MSTDDLCHECGYQLIYFLGIGTGRRRDVVGLVTNPPTK